MVLSDAIRSMVKRGFTRQLIANIPGSVTGSARTLLINRIWRRQHAAILASWPTS